VSRNAAPRHSFAEAALSVGVLLLGVATGVGTAMLPSQGGTRASARTSCRA